MIRKLGYTFLVGLLTAEILLRKLAAYSLDKLSHYSPKVLRRKFRVGNLFSRLLRPLFESKKIRAVFGANLAAGVLAVGSLGVPFEAETGMAYPGISNVEVVLNIDEPVLTTDEVGFQVPTVELIGISTRFRSGHAGYDLRAPLGSEVRPITDGVVVSVIHSVLGYGRRVILKHDDGLVSLYAHLGLITVDEGDTVTLDTKLGEVGLTGWTTGPHVHLEIYKNEIAVNPVNYLVF